MAAEVLGTSTPIRTMVSNGHFSTLAQCAAIFDVHALRVGELVRSRHICKTDYLTNVTHSYSIAISATGKRVQILGRAGVVVPKEQHDRTQPG
jgi:hypothetical protein